MRMKMLTLVVTLVLLLNVCALPAFAATYDSASCSWSSENASYGPDDGEFYVRSYTGQTYDIKAYTYVLYDSSDINSILDYADDSKYPGLDITEINNTGYDAWGAYSDLPDPDYDYDDDDWDFEYEEAEVTCNDPWSLNANEAYYFNVYFDNNDGCNQGTFQLNTSESLYTQTVQYSQLGSSLTVDMP